MQALNLFALLVNDFRHLLALMLARRSTRLLLLYRREPERRSVSEVVETALAAFGGIVATVIGYYFGSRKRGTSADTGPESSWIRRQPGAAHARRSPFTDSAADDTSESGGWRDRRRFDSDDVRLRRSR